MRVRACTHAATPLLAENAYFQAVTKVGFHCRTALSTSVYRKALRMSPVARQDTPVGTIVNLMQLDAQRIDSLVLQLHTAWDSWYQILGYMLILYYFLGLASLAGLLCMILLIPVQGFVMARMQTLRRAITIVNDQRIKVTNEVLQGVRAVKLYHWEDAYIKIIGKIRNEELTAIRGLA